MHGAIYGKCSDTFVNRSALRIFFREVYPPNREMSDLEQPEQAIDQAVAQIDGLLAQLEYYR